MQKQIYVGLDLGSSRCRQAVIDADGSPVFSCGFPITENEHHKAVFFQSSFSAKIARHPAIINISPAAANQKRKARGGQVKLCA